MKKTLRAIFPTEERDPHLGFQYFDQAAARPFEPMSTAPSWRKAWWCAQLALLAYAADEDWVAGRLALAGWRGKLFTHGRQQCVLAHDGAGHAVLAFRGTEIVTPSDFGRPLPALLERFRASGWDWAGNLDFRPVPWPHGGGQVHKGFLEGHDVMERHPELRASLQEVAQGSLWLAGHSLGGALATLAAASPLGSRAAGLFTFGAPPGGDAAFAETVRVPHCRFVNGDDAVPRVPLGAVGFVHHGRLVHRPVASATGLFARVGVHDGVAGLLQFLSPDADALPGAFVHHAPLLYVAQCVANLEQPL